MRGKFIAYYRVSRQSDGDEITIHILAVVAEAERDMTATWTREAFPAARRAGKQILGETRALSPYY